MQLQIQYKINMYHNTICSIILSSCIFLYLTVSAQSEAPSDPEGTLLIENDNPAVTNNFEGKPEKMGGLEVSGGTVLKLGVNQQAGNGNRTISVTPTFSKEGLYKVLLRWATPKAGAYAHNVPVTLTHKNGQEQFKVNQRGGNAWVNLGTYSFDQGTQIVLEMNNKGIMGNANFDAIKLIPVAALPASRPAPPVAAATDDFEKLCHSIRSYLVALNYGKGDAETDPHVIAKQRENERLALIYWGTMDPSPDRISNWQAQSNQKSDKRTAEATWLKELAIAYAGATNHLGGDLRGNPDLLQSILDGLKIFQQRYNASTKWDVNWWDYEIGIPTQVLETLCILGDAVPQEIRDNYIASAARFNSDPNKYYNNSFASTGANRLWLCHVAMLRGALAKDSALLDLVKKSVLQPLEFVVRKMDSKKKDSADGYYEDGSFIQHGGIPYVAAYGYLLLDTYAKVAECLQGTPWQLNAPSAANAFRIMEICFDPFVVRGETVQNVVGRSLGARSYEGNQNAANFVVTASKLLAFANPEQASRLRSLIKKWITEEKEGKLLETALIAADESNPVSTVKLKEIIADKSVVPLPPRQGFEMFANMDMATHRHEDFTASLGMNSSRIMTFETIFGANAKGWFQSEGMLLIYTPDIERYRDAFFNLVDPYRFPGVTVERFERTPGDGGTANPGKLGGGDFVGGVALDGNGIAAMHLKPAVGALEARRAWFFLGGQIVCLGAGIGAASENPIETTIDNARLISEKQQLLVDGKLAAEGAATQWPGAKWAWLGGTRPGADLAWVFLDGNPVLNTIIETRNGSRKDTHIKTGDETPLSMRFATLWLDHGKGLSNSTYAYVILPGRNPDAVKAYAAKPGVEILSNTAEMQAVRDKAAGFTCLAAHQPGEVSGISLSQPGLAMVAEKAGAISLAISDPTMKLKTPVRLKTTLTAKSAIKTDECIKVISLSPLEIEFTPNGLNGQTRRAEFTR